MNKLLPILLLSALTLSAQTNFTGQSYNTTGTVTASAFTGSGSGLTNIPAAALATGAATSGQVLTYNGTSYAPSNSSPAGYTITLAAVNSITPAAGSIPIYIGGLLGTSATLATSYSNAAVMIPKTGVIKSYTLKTSITGTLGTTESLTNILRLNNTTDVGQLVLNYSITNRDDIVTLNQPVVAGDIIALKILPPFSWVTQPTNMRWYCLVYIE